jgi:hypothetical protein
MNEALRSDGFPEKPRVAVTRHDATTASWATTGRTDTGPAKCCDFCNTPYPPEEDGRFFCWEFQCTDFVTNADGIGITANGDYTAVKTRTLMEGNWYACTPCTWLIAAADWDGLLGRCATSIRPSLPDMDMAEIRDMLTATQEGFITHFTGHVRRAQVVFDEPAG